MSASRRKGTAWESAVVAFLQERGFPYAERRALRGTDDRGDVAGIPGVVIECKAEKAIALGEYMNEVAVETKNASARVGVAVVKRRQKPVGEAYVVMTLDQFVELLAEEST